MDPATLAGITAEVWKVGGIVACLMVLLVVVVFIFGRFLFQLVRTLSHRLDSVQAEKTDILTTHIMKGNGVMSELINETRAQTGQLRLMTEGLRQRKCMVDDTPHKTPLPTFPSTHTAR
jgi:hypothetical protein